ncbi:MAG: DUF3794 domain-containing protein [Oscillospiraceae bacterium]|nr:DUF3794 domain-containing protein [Oscillospiraceae bacterium]
MEYRTQSDQIILSEILFEGASEQPVDIDFTLPDYCPDIGKILTCKMTPAVTSRDISGGRVTAAGTVKLEIIYLDGREGKVFACNYDLPFENALATEELSDRAKAEITVKVDYVNCRATSQRRVDIHGAFTLGVKVSAPTQAQALSDASGGGVFVKKTACRASAFVGHTQAPFSISEALELAPGKPPIASVISSAAAISVTDAKAIANKLAVKGEALLRLVYRTDSGESLESMEFSIPFNQFFDLLGADDSCLMDVKIDAPLVDLNLRTDNDGEYRRLTAEIKAFADIKSYRPTDITFVTDAYSTEYDVELERKNMRLSRLERVVSHRGFADSTVDFGAVATERIEGVCARVHSISGRVQEGKIMVSGKISCGAIAVDASGDTGYTESLSDFETEFPVDDVVEGAVSPNAYVRAVSYNLVGANKLEVRAELEITAAVYIELTLPAVSDIRVGEAAVKNAGCGGVTLYFADPGEELWDIAKEHGSSVESIRETNELSEDILSGKHTLLIAN